MIGLLGTLLIAGLLFPAPSAGILSFRYGKLERSRDVTGAFEDARISSEFNYYYNGLGNIPFAVIGIDKAYRLRKELWQPIELTPQKLRGWVRQMGIIYDGFPPYGSYILDDNGKRIGVWYSSKQWTTIIIEDENQVAVFAPEPPGFGRP